MPSHTNTATTSTPPEQPLGTMRPQTGPGPGPGDPGPQPQTLPDASTRSHRPATPTRDNLEPHPHHSPPVRPTTSPTHGPSDCPPAQTHTATPTNATSTRPEQPLGTMGPNAHIPTGSPSPQAPAKPCTPTPGYHPPAWAQAEPTPQHRHDPPYGLAVGPTEAPSGSHLAPSPDPDRHPMHATIPTDAPPSKRATPRAPDGGPVSREQNTGSRARRGGAEWQHAGTGRPPGRPAQAGTRDGWRDLSGDAYERQRSHAACTARPATTRGAHGGGHGGSGGTPRAEGSATASGGPNRPGTTQSGDI